MRKTVVMIINDALRDDAIPLMGLVDYLLSKGYPLTRILAIADKAFGIPKEIALNTCQYFC